MHLPQMTVKKISSPHIQSYCRLYFRSLKTPMQSGERKKHLKLIFFFLISGSGSGYIYGYCDATFKPGMTKEQCFTFVSNGLFFIFLKVFIVS